MAECGEAGVLNLRSPYSVADTVARLEAAFTGAKLTVFATIDQQRAGADAGLAMRPMTLVIFGSPAAGTPLMQRYPTLAIDLPLKALAWEDGEGRVWVTTNDPAYLQRRHGMPEGSSAYRRSWREH